MRRGVEPEPALFDDQAAILYVEQTRVFSYAARFCRDNMQLKP